MGDPGGGDESRGERSEGPGGALGVLGRILSLLIPSDERALVLSELDDLRTRGRTRDRPRNHGPSGRERSGLWYLVQLVSFGVRLRLEPLRRLPHALEGLSNDLIFALRTLVRRPGYLTAAVATLAVGTGGVAVVYGAADWVLLREVPGVSEPDRLAWVRLESTEPPEGLAWGIMHPDLELLRARMPSLERFEASTEMDVHFRIPDGTPAARLRASMVTPGYFRLLGLSPSIGRLIDPDDHVAHDGPAEAVVSHDLWHRYWAGSPDVIGSEVEVNGRPYTVIGVVPEGFRGAELPGSSSLWLTTSAFGDVRPADAASGLDGTTQLWDRLIGRRMPGASVEQVEAEANAAMETIRRDRSDQMNSFMATHFVFEAYRGIGLDPGIREQVRSTLTILGSAGLVLLLLATANVASLGLTRAASRRGLSAIRRALGAGSWRVAREPILEGLVIGLAGGALGLVVVLGGGALFGEASLSSQGASLDGMSIGPGVVLFTLGVSLAAGLVSGVIPAWAVGRDRALVRLGGHRRGGRATTRARSVLVVGQVALSGALLVTAVLFGRTMLNLTGIDLGYPRDAVSFSIDAGLDSPDPASAAVRLDRVMEGLQQRLGPHSVGLVYPRPLRGWSITGALREPGVAQDDAIRGSTFWISGNDFLSSLGLELVAGEGFDRQVGATVLAERQVAINESMARRAFPDLPLPAVVGRSVILGRDTEESRIVGVVADARLVSPYFEPRPLIFEPYAAAAWDASASVYLRSERTRAEVMAVVREVLQGVDAGLPIYDVSTVRDQVNGLLVEERVVARLAGAVSLIGALLVAIGLYGVLSYTVQDRTREIGVRTALGAPGVEIRHRVMGRGVGLVLAGLVAAIPLAWWATRYVEAQLYGVERLDPLAYALGVTFLLAVALVASWIPAQRAMRISPVEALRAE